MALLSSSKNDSLLRLHTAAWKCHTLQAFAPLVKIGVQKTILSFGLRRSFGQIAREKEMLLEGEEKCIEAIERKKRIQSSILYVPTDTDVSHASPSSLPNRPCCVHVLLSFSLGAQELTSQQ